MEFEFNMKELEKNLTGLQQQIFAKKAMYKAGVETESSAKEIINTFENEKGHSQGVDSGGFRDTVHSDEIEEGFGFAVRDSVPFGIFHEFGTVEHFVPFFDESGAITSLGQWAMRHFDLDGPFQVIGKKGKALKAPSRKSREDILRTMGGIMVSLDEMAPFRRALAETKANISKIFKEEFEWQMKQ
jgi:hypothetical protein